MATWVRSEQAARPLTLSETPMTDLAVSLSQMPTTPRSDPLSVALLSVAGLLVSLALMHYGFDPGSALQLS
jgi:hypothetical protein